MGNLKHTPCNGGQEGIDTEGVLAGQCAASVQRRDSDGTQRHPAVFALLYPGRSWFQVNLAWTFEVDEDPKQNGRDCWLSPHKSSSFIESTKAWDFIMGVGCLQSCLEGFWGRGRFGEHEPSWPVVGTSLTVELILEILMLSSRTSV